MNKHTDEVIKRYQKHWKKQLVQWSRENRMAGGEGLTLNGCLIKGMDTQVMKETHRGGTELQVVIY